MSSDEVRWCEKRNRRVNSDSVSASTDDFIDTAYTLFPIYRLVDAPSLSAQIDDQLHVDFMENSSKRRNSLKRDNRITNNSPTDSTSPCSSNQHSSTASRNYYRFINLYFLIVLYVICNDCIISVNCDELMESVGARGHFTHTWAVHIPGGDAVAEQVAADHGMLLRGKIFDDHYHFEHRSIAKRSIMPSQHHQNLLDDDDRVHWSKQQRAKSRQKRDFTRLKPTKTYTKILNDPKWTAMWYLNRGNGFDMNVIPAWRDGITGKGVVVTILDDGLETDHPDLERNYDPEASWDVNGHDADPMPHYDMTDSNRHGTRCAGEVAATANNSLCAVGIAFDARVGGVRMLDGDVTDAVEAASLGLKPQHIDIYSASWGPDDDGKTVDGPGEMATKAFIDGVTKGRGGKGSIFIWASGNGGREQDNCNCDGYTNSVWTLSISSATEEGDIPWYSEKCSSTLATTYSSGQQGEKQVITTDLHHMCTASHTGTSASAPLAAGIAALALEANPNLTWRDLQHIVVRTANPTNLGKSPSEWLVNGVGRKVSHSFGYGLMDAAAMVRLARVWETVPEQQRCEIHSQHLDKPIPPRRNVTFALKVDHCKGVNYLEHVQARISLTTQRRGDIIIYLTSPSGTRTCLLTERVHDVSRSGFSDWPFMSVHTWGEAPQGVWQLEIHNKGRYMGQITQWNLVLHGTDDPAQKNDPPRYVGSNKKAVNLDIHNALAEPSQWNSISQDEDSLSHSDVQRTVENDLTSSACSHFSDNNKSFCLECTHQTFIYDGKCFLFCPERTYIVTEQIPVSQQSKGLSLKRRRSMNIDEFDNLDDIIGSSEMIAKNNRAIELGLIQKMCGSCHESCLKCNGPLASHCLICDSEYEKAFIGSSVTCEIKMDNLTVTTIDKIASHLKDFTLRKIILISSLVGLFLFVSCISVYHLCIKCDHGLASIIITETKELFRQKSPIPVTMKAERDRNYTGKYSYNQVRLEEKESLTGLTALDDVESGADSDGNEY